MVWINLVFAQSLLFAEARAQDLSASLGVEHHVDALPGLGIRAGGQLGLTERVPLFVGAQLTFTPGSLQPSDFTAGLVEVVDMSGSEMQVPIERRVLSMDVVVGLSPVLLQRGQLRGGPLFFAGFGYARYEHAFVVGGEEASVSGLTVRPALPVVSGAGLDARFGSHFGVRLSLTGHRYVGDEPQYDPDVPPFGKSIHLDRTAALDLEVYL